MPLFPEVELLQAEIDRLRAELAEKTLALEWTIEDNKHQDRRPSLITRERLARWREAVELRREATPNSMTRILWRQLRDAIRAVETAPDCWEGE